MVGRVLVSIGLAAALSLGITACSTRAPLPPCELRQHQADQSGCDLYPSQSTPPESTGRSTVPTSQPAAEAPTQHPESNSAPATARPIAPAPAPATDPVTDPAPAPVTDPAPAPIDFWLETDPPSYHRVGTSLLVTVRSTRGADIVYFNVRSSAGGQVLYAVRISGTPFNGVWRASYEKSCPPWAQRGDVFASATAADIDGNRQGRGDVQIQC